MYIHLLFARHEIIIANGARSESYYPGHAVSRSERQVQAEVLALFPELREQGPSPLAARTIIRPRDGKLLAI